MNGYMGKILVVDLTKKELKDEPLNEQYARDFIGGRRYRLPLPGRPDRREDRPAGTRQSPYLHGRPAHRHGWPQLQPLGGRRTLPLYYLLWDSNGAAHFGSELRFSGYDGIIVKGKSDKPVYLYIKDGKAELKTLHTLG